MFVVVVWKKEIILFYFSPVLVATANLRAIGASTPALLVLCRLGSGVGILGDGLILDESAGTITADFCWVDDIWDYFACVQIDENVHMEIMYSSIKEVKLPNPDLSVIR